MRPNLSGKRMVAAVLLALLIVGGAALWALQRSFTGPADEPDPTPASTLLPAPAPEPPGRIVRVECRQGACQWFRILRMDRVATGADGELSRLTYRRGSSPDDGNAPAAAAQGVAWEPDDRTGFAYCSRSRPAFAFPDDAADGSGALIVHYLDPFNLVGYQLASAKLYALVCHDAPETADPVSALQALGYRPGTPSEQVQVSSPEALLRP